MKKVLLLSAAAFAAGMVASQAQTYSVNTVGYVNTVLVLGHNVINNPLSNGTNGLDTILPLPVKFEGSVVTRWDNTAQDFTIQSTAFNTGGSSVVWSPAMAINPGESFDLSLANDVDGQTSVTNTFVGDVLQGTIPVQVGVPYSFPASPVPIGGAIATVLTQFPSGDGDIVTLYDVNGEGSTQSTYFNPPGQWGPSIDIAVGQGFSYYTDTDNNGLGARTWNRTFTVQ